MESVFPVADPGGGVGRWQGWPPPPLTLSWSWNPMQSVRDRDRSPPPLECWWRHVGNVQGGGGCLWMSRRGCLSIFWRVDDVTQAMSGVCVQWRSYRGEGAGGQLPPPLALENGKFGNLPSGGKWHPTTVRFWILTTSYVDMDFFLATITVNHPPNNWTRVEVHEVYVKNILSSSDRTFACWPLRVLSAWTNSHISVRVLSKHWGAVLTGDTPSRSSSAQASKQRMDFSGVFNSAKNSYMSTYTECP